MAVNKPPGVPRLKGVPNIPKIKPPKLQKPPGIPKPRFPSGNPKFK